MQDLYWGFLCVFFLSLGWQAGKHGERLWVIARQAGQFQADKIFPPDVQQPVQPKEELKQ